MAFWKKNNHLSAEKDGRPEWLNWNVPQWIEHLSPSEKARVMSLPTEEKTREFLDWYMKKSQEYDSGDTIVAPLNPTGSHTDVGIPYGAKMAEYNMSTMGGIRPGAPGGGVFGGFGRPGAFGGPMGQGDPGGPH